MREYFFFYTSYKTLHSNKCRPIKVNSPNIRFKTWIINCLNERAKLCICVILEIWLNVFRILFLSSLPVKKLSISFFTLCTCIILKGPKVHWSCYFSLYFACLRPGTFFRSIIPWLHVDSIMTWSTLLQLCIVELYRNDNQVFQCKIKWRTNIYKVSNGLYSFAIAFNPLVTCVLC